MAPDGISLKKASKPPMLPDTLRTEIETPCFMQMRFAVECRSTGRSHLKCRLRSMCGRQRK